MFQIITVKPKDQGWCLVSEATAETVMFASGAKAEAAARDLALTLADQGEAVKVEIWLRDGRLAGRLVCTSASHGLSAAA